MQLRQARETTRDSSTVLNAAMAELSREFFIAAEVNRETVGLRSALGNRAEFLNESEMKSIVLDSLERVLQK
jgi:hypothetical protein